MDVSGDSCAPVQAPKVLPCAPVQSASRDVEPVTSCAPVQCPGGGDVPFLEEMVRRCGAIDLDNRPAVMNSLEQVFFIRSGADWEHFLKKLCPDFMNNIRRAGFFTLDVEDNIDRKTKSSPTLLGMESIILGDPVSGNVVVLMVQPYYDLHKSMEEILPTEWQNILSDNSLWKFGVGIKSDFEQILGECHNLSQVNRVVEVADFISGSHVLQKLWPKMADCSGGLKQICRLDQGVIYGIGNIRKKHGCFNPRRFWHTHVLYKWELASRSRSSKPYLPQACAYLLNDGRYIYRFIAKICLKYMNQYRTDCLAETLDVLFNAFQVPVGSGFDVSTSSVDAHLPDVPEVFQEPLAADAVCRLCSSKGHNWKECQTLEQAEDSLDFYERALLQGEEIDPFFPVRCDFCGSQSHHWDQCQARKREETCRYSFCSESACHTVRVCPALHHRCQSCSLRGHFEDRCVPYEEARAAFLVFHSLGFYTRFCDRPVHPTRPALVNFGLFPVPLSLARLPSHQRGFSHTQLLTWGKERALDICRRGVGLGFRKRLRLEKESGEGTAKRICKESSVVPGVSKRT